MPLDLNTLTTEQKVTALFIGYFDRAPAVNGFDYYVADLDDRGLSLEAVAMAFVDQSETEALYPGIMDTADRSPAENLAFVTAVFQNLFGRDPNVDADGNNYWVDELNGGADAGLLILQIMGGANATDEAVLRNKITVGEAYVAAAREADVLTRDDAGDTVFDGVTDDSATVDAALEAIDDAFEAPVVVVPTNVISLNPDAVTIAGTDGNDVFEAESGDLTSSIRIDGGAGTDAITVFNETGGNFLEAGVAMSPRTENVEQFYMTNQANDLTSVADNNVGGYTNGTTIMVDVEVDGGRMVGINRWEDYDSRADLVIEDARDSTPEDGTFTAEQTVAMVSTDPGNVDFAVYFDDPTNTSTDSGTLTVRLLDLDSAAQGEGPLNDNPYDEVRFTIDGETQTLTIDALAAANVSYAAYVAALQASADDQDIPVTITLGGQFTLLQADGSPEVGTEILITVDNGTIGEGGFNASAGLPANNNTVTRQIVNNATTEALISLNVEFDDVGKGSTGGDALFGAMSTGRQTGDDATSDSIGIQQFDITVDRSSQLQTINSTNNALEVVNIGNGENSGLNNTTNSDDEMIGDLAVRGQANPGLSYGFIADDALTDEDESLGDFGLTDGIGRALLGNTFSTVATDGAMPGALPQHNAFGFTDVREINASAMTGAVDITAELTEEIVEKYLDITDRGPNGETDDIDFAYTLGNGSDEFTLNLSDDALNSAGTGSREDFDMTISGGNGNDVITTNVGDAVKLVDEQGQDHYALASTNGEAWYTNAVSNVAAEMSVFGGAGADTIWTHGWGDFTIDGGADRDVVYTDNSGAVEAAQRLATNIDRNLTEHDQIDYVVGGVWAFNAENLAVSTTDGSLSMTGATNDTITLGTVTGVSATNPFTANSGSAVFTVSYGGASGAAGTSYNIRVTIPFSELNVNSTTGVVTTSEQALNQAIKAGINSNQVLGNLLEAADGPGNSLVIATKTDGDHASGDLSVAYTSLTINNNAPLTTAGESFTGDAGYTTTAANFINLGAASTAESDNTIRSGTDGADDLFVLSTNDAATTPATVNGGLSATDLNGASNEVIEFDNGFGRDTILNFDAGDNAAGDTTGEDVLDFDLLFADGTFAASTLVKGAITGATANGEITLASEIGGTGPTSNDTLAEIQAMYTAADTTASTTVAEEIVIVYDANDNNAGAVYAVTDGTGAGDVAVTFEGTINLVGTAWTTLEIDNFA
ncbi:Outer membrane adhesin-like protein [Sulfitobacter noctilucicola]|uniref:DUF4214 domain-containing protein n=1 Tax=Sulfitobacter noctilucicola TaxID=1342301 RepID=A0A7W6MBV8_9RHOB|nr:DUF4214 domain-containing protein [Sulfitobacter noctilucicola]KIN69848.1 Outer membrane adhesin-like protein [Sulfitobacter noctilucicola]MBB4176216.1 hypothetical protein [Sulfitobacter noctilucicola]